MTSRYGDPECVLSRAKRYRLIDADSGGPIWIVDTVESWRNPLFTLAPRDRKYAKHFLANLTAID